LGFHAAQVVAVLLALAEELAQEDVVNIEQIDLQFSEAAQRVDSLLPAGWEMGLNVTHLEAISFLQGFEQGMLVANLSRDIADDVDILGMPAQVPSEDQSDGAPYINAHRLVQANTNFTKELTDVFGVGLSHETFWEGRIAYFLEFFGADCFNAIARGALSQP